MKASELVRELQKWIAKEHDPEVYVRSGIVSFEVEPVARVGALPVWSGARTRYERAKGKIQLLPEDI